MQIRAIHGLTAAAMALAGSPALAEGPSLKWDMPMAYAATTYHSGQGQIFADKVRAYTNGALDITLHPGGALLTGSAIKDAVQTGQVSIGERFMSAHADEAPLLGWDTLPFLATTYAGNAKLWAVARDSVNAQLSDLNMVALYTCPWPGQGFFFDREVTSAADIQGMKSRSFNATTAKLTEKLGMIPVQIETGELPQALARGDISALIATGAVGYDQRIWEHMTHFYPANAWLPRNYVVANRQAWDALDTALQAGVLKAAEETAASCAARSEELSDFYEAELARKGMTVSDPSPEFLAELRQIGERITAEWLETTGAEGQAIIDAYRAAN